MMLTLLVFAPLLFMLILWLMPSDNKRLLKLVGVLGTVIPLVLSLIIAVSGHKWSSYDVYANWFQLGNTGNEFSQMYAVPFELGIDGFSFVMILLTAVLSTLAAIASTWQIEKGWKGYFSLFLLLETGMLGVFAAENLILFFLFFEVTLVATFFLVGKWGGFDREKAAYRFLIYNGLGSAILLFVIAVLFAKTGTSNIEILKQILSLGGQTLLSPISSELKYGLLIALIVAFGIKLPIFPLHSWVLKVHVEAPPAVVMLHAGILLKIGAYGLIQFAVGLFPEEFSKISFWIILLGVINLLYGAFLALIQTNFKLLLAYSSVSHMGIVLMGLGAMNDAGMQGAIFQVVSHGLIASLFFLLVGVLQDRYETTDMRRLGGLWNGMPVFSGFLLTAGMASLGLPGLSGFVSEFLAFLGVFEKEAVLGAIGALGLILTAVYVLRSVLKMTFGSGDEQAHDLRLVEWVPAAVLVGIIVLIGVYPSILERAISGIGG